MLFRSVAVLGGCMWPEPTSAASRATRLGVVSDTHVTGPDSVDELAAAFRFLRDRGVDAVVHCGDVTDAGTLEQLDAFAKAWHMVFDERTPLVVALGNRDMMDSRRIPDSVREAAKGRAVKDDPQGAFRKALGIDWHLLLHHGIHHVQCLLIHRKVGCIQCL